MRSGLKSTVMAFAALGSLMLLSATAQACPMCSLSIAEEDMLPKAYMYSILFMLGMPMTVFCGIGSVVLLKYRRFQAQQPIGIAGDELVTGSEPRK
jgi:hypothetical protein